MADDLEYLAGDEKIIRQAKDRFQRCESYYGTANALLTEDMLFAIGDSDNMTQWPEDQISQGPTDEVRLTINKTRTHCLQIENEGKQNKSSINIRPTGNGATKESAEVYEDVVRYIQRRSNYDGAKAMARKTQIRGGVGYFRILTDWAADDGPEAFTQDIFFKTVRDPTSVYIDPDAVEDDKSDMRYAFVFEDMPRDDFEADYPDEDVPSTSLEQGAWASKDHVRVAEYYRVTRKKERLILTKNGDVEKAILASEIDKPILKALDSEPKENRARERDVWIKKVEWYKIAGDRIVDRQVDYPGVYIPIITMIGEEFVIKGELHRNGHVRHLKDPQRMLNYWVSKATSSAALQGDQPYLATAEAIEGYETEWANANISKKAALIYNGVDDKDRPIPPPQRQQPAISAPAYLTGMQFSEQQMMMASGQYQAQLGENENAKSGKAIAERQRQGDNATYHFIDGEATADRYAGKILIDLIPKIYDTKRVIRMMAKDRSEAEVEIDPEAQAAYFRDQARDGEDVRAIFNPSVGKYDVEADVGPSYATQRQEAFNAFSQILTQNPGLVQVAGDILFAYADFPGSQEMSDRLARGVPSQYKEDGPDPEVAQLQQQIQELQGKFQATTAELLEKLAKAQIEIKNKTVGHQIQAQDAAGTQQIQAYDAETRRLTAIGNSGPAVSPDQIKPLFDQWMKEAQKDANPTGGLSGQSEQSAPAPSLPQPPMQGARHAPDGQWYVKHPGTGQYYRVDKKEAA